MQNIPLPTITFLSELERRQDIIADVKRALANNELAQDIMQLFCIQPWNLILARRMYRQLRCLIWYLNDVVRSKLRSLDLTEELFQLICYVYGIEDSVKEQMLNSIIKQYQYPLYGVAALIIEKKSKQFLAVQERGHVGLPKGKIEEQDCSPELLNQNLITQNNQYQNEWGKQFSSIYNNEQAQVVALQREVLEECGLNLTLEQIQQNAFKKFTFSCRRDIWDVHLEVYTVYVVIVDDLHLEALKPRWKIEIQNIVLLKEQELSILINKNSIYEKCSNKLQKLLSSTLQKCYYIELKENTHINKYKLSTSPSCSTSDKKNESVLTAPESEDDQILEQDQQIRDEWGQ